MQSTVRSLFGNCEVSDRAKCCKEFLRRIARYLIKLGAGRSLLGELYVSD